MSSFFLTNPLDLATAFSQQQTVTGAQAYSLMSTNAATIAAQYNASKTSTEFWFGALLTALGAYKQYKMFDQQGDLFEAQMKHTDQAREIARSNFFDLYKPQFERSTGNYWGDVNPWAKAAIRGVVTCGTKICEYVKDQNTINRTTAKIPQIVANARRLANATRKYGQVGVCMNNDYRFAQMEASLAVKYMGIAERYEDTKKLSWDQFYWNRQSGSASIAQNQQSIAANLVSSSASGLSSAMGQVQQAAAAGLAAVQGYAAVQENMAGWWGGVGQIGGMIGGFGQGQSAGIGLINSYGSGLGSGGPANAGGFGASNSYASPSDSQMTSVPGR
jgi:hypothetical protein